MEIQYYIHNSKSIKQIFIYRKKEGIYELYNHRDNKWINSLDQSNDHLTPITKEEALIELL